MGAALDGDPEIADRSEATSDLTRSQALRRGRMLEYLTLVQVAFDDETDACEAYLALRAAEPEHRWDPDQISPKVILMTSVCQAP